MAGVFEEPRLVPLRESSGPSGGQYETPDGSGR